MVDITLIPASAEGGQIEQLKKEVQGVPGTTDQPVLSFYGFDTELFDVDVYVEDATGASSPAATTRGLGSVTALAAPPPTGPVGGATKADIAKLQAQLDALLASLTDLFGLTGAQRDEVMALTYSNCDADPAASPSWSKVGMTFDAIDLADGGNYHFYCGDDTYVPGSSNAQVKPTWHRVEKLGDDTKKDELITVLDSNTAGFGLSDYNGNTSPSAWPTLLGQQMADKFGTTLNLGVSGNKYQDGLARMGALTGSYDGSKKIYIIDDAGINNAIAGDSISQTTALLKQFYAQLKAAAPGRVFIIKMTLPAAIVPDSTFRTPAEITAFINDFNADLRLHAVSDYGADLLFDLARMSQAQNPGPAYYTSENSGTKFLHWNSQLHALVAAALEQFVRKGTQPTGSILSNAGGSASPSYLTNFNAVSLTGTKLATTGTKVVALNPPNAGPTFGNVGTTNRFLPASTDGCVGIFLSAASDFNGVFCLVKANAFSGFADSFVAGYASQDSPTAQTSHLAFLVNGAFTITNIVNTVALHLVIWRRSGVLTLETTTDNGKTWTQLGAPLATYAGDLYLFADIANNGQINYFQTYNFQSVSVSSQPGGYTGFVGPGFIDSEETNPNYRAITSGSQLAPGGRNGGNFVFFGPGTGGQITYRFFGTGFDLWSVTDPVTNLGDIQVQINGGTPTAVPQAVSNPAGTGASWPYYSSPTTAAQAYEVVLIMPANGNYKSDDGLFARG